MVFEFKIPTNDFFPFPEIHSAILLSFSSTISSFVSFNSEPLTKSILINSTFVNSSFISIFNLLTSLSSFGTVNLILLAIA